MTGIGVDVRGSGSAFEARITAVLVAHGVPAEQCRNCEWGMNGGGGFVIDNGSEAKITHLHCLPGKLKVRFVLNTDYTVMEIETDEPMRMGRALLAELPCTATEVMDTTTLRFKVRRWWHSWGVFDLIFGSFKIAFRVIAFFLSTPLIGVIGILLGMLLRTDYETAGFLLVAASAFQLVVSALFLRKYRR